MGAAGAFGFGLGLVGPLVSERPTACLILSVALEALWFFLDMELLELC